MLNNIKDILIKNKKNIWIMYNRNNADKYFCKYICNNLSTNSVCVISQTDIYLLIHELDKANVPDYMYNTSYLHIMIYRNMSEYQNDILTILTKLNMPNEICLSYSTSNDENIDILTHGQFLNISRLLKNLYKTSDKRLKITSAEDLIYDLEAQKTNLDIQRLKLISSITNTILYKAFEKIEVGMSEVSISNLTKDIASEIMDINIGKNDIVSFDMAWGDPCPIVLIGKNFLKGGHSIASSYTLKRGETIYFDFGLKVDFSDGTTLYTDMQRMGYAMNENQVKVPKEVMKVFNTLVTAIKKGIKEMKPGVRAYKIDDIVRGEILNNGYPNYNHATGHPVGFRVHDIGVSITTKSNKKRLNKKLVENAVYTLEPRISVENGGSIEEMILVTKTGGIPICNTQNELYIIK